jgi:hypothetical protein
MFNKCSGSERQIDAPTARAGVDDLAEFFNDPREHAVAPPTDDRFQGLHNAALTIAGIAPLRRIWTGQFELRRGRASPVVWKAVPRA